MGVVGVRQNAAYQDVVLERKPPGVSISGESSQATVATLTSTTAQKCRYHEDESLGFGFNNHGVCPFTAQASRRAGTIGGVPSILWCHSRQPTVGIHNAAHGQYRGKRDIPHVCQLGEYVEVSVVQAVRSDLSMLGKLFPEI